VHILQDESSNFQGLFYQDHRMKQTFDVYPELTFVDATYKLLQIHLPVYLTLCEDSNGQSEITSVCLLATEDAESLTWMMDMFKKDNKNWTKTRAVMADKDIGERDSIKHCFPDACVFICLFHTLRSFQREISSSKIGISAGKRALCLELLQKMAYASSDGEYEDLYMQFTQDAPVNVVEYFNANWHPIHEEWVLGLKAQCGSFLNKTNNRIECFNAKLKQVISRNSSLEEFVENFFIAPTALRKGVDHKAAAMIHKTPVRPWNNGSPESNYTTLLTPYAVKYIVQQLQRSKAITHIVS